MTVASHAAPRGTAQAPARAMRVAWRLPARALRHVPAEASALIERAREIDADLEVAWVVTGDQARVELAWTAGGDREQPPVPNDAARRWVLFEGSGDAHVDALGLTHIEACCDGVRLVATLRGERVLWASTQVLGALGVRGGCYELA